MPTGREQSTGSGDDLLVTNRSATEGNYDGKPTGDPSQKVRGEFDAEFADTTPPASQTRPAQDDGGQTSDDQLEKKWIEQTFGVSIEEIREVVQDKREGKAAASFVTDHASDYAATPHNYQVLQNFLDSNNLPLTRESLETAFAATQGQLETSRGKGQQAPPRKPSQSGISDSQGAPIVPVTLEQGIADAYTMPLDQLRRTIQARAHGKPAASRDDF
jgi:hypothetical protein